MPRIQGRIDPDGAVINVKVEVGAADAADLRSRNMPIPPPFPTTALIDTGASRTALHPIIVQQLGLVPRGFTRAGMPGPTGHASQNVRLFDARIALDSPQFTHPPIPVEAAEVVPATQTVLILIGRDILEQCTLYFDGQNRAFSLWF
jgi:hypothetical protein